MIKVIKIVDTITFHGAAEKHIVLNAEFERFVKKTYGSRVDILKTDVNQIAKKYNIKGFVFGNYVTQEERYHFLYKLSKQLEALAKIGGSEDLGKGKLIIGFGSHGKKGSLAFFNARDSFINLNRGRKGTYTDVLQGENSFIHEYGHFLDSLQGQKDQTSSEVWATKIKAGGELRTTVFADLVADIKKDEKYMQGLVSKDKGLTRYLQSDIEIFARIFESGLTHYIVDKWKGQHAFFDASKYGTGWYLKKDVIKARGYDKILVAIISGKIPKAKATPTKIKAPINSKDFRDNAPIFLEWTEGADLPDGKGYNTIEELEKDLKKFGFTDKPNSTYIKNKVWFKGYDFAVRIDLSKSKGDYNPLTTKLLDWLNKYYHDFNFNQYSKPKKKAAPKKLKGQQSLFDKKS